MGKRPELRFIFLFLIFIALFGVSVVLHELSHAVAAIILGVSPAELTFGWYGLGPGVTPPETFPVKDLVHFRYAGGLGSGLVLLTAYAVYVLRFESVKRAKWLSSRWWTPRFILFWSLFQFYNGYIESMHFEEYVRNSIDYTIPFLLILLVAGAIHFSLYYAFSKNKPNN